MENKTPKLPKVLWISDFSGLLQVGQSNVGFNCLNRLKQWYEVEEIGWGYSSAPKNALKVSWKVYDSNRQVFNTCDEENVNKVISIIKESNPDVVIFSHDPFLHQNIHFVRPHFPNIKFIGYLTFDGGPAYYGYSNWLRPYDKILSPTEFGKKIVLDRWVDLNVAVVNYGLDHSIFKVPKQGKEQLKIDLWKASNGLFDVPNKFVALYVGANQDRKNLGLMVEAWKLFEKNKEDKVRFYIITHSASLTQQIGSYDLAYLKLQCKSLQIINQEITDHDLGALTAGSDILLHTSQGEGWGLTVTNSMACGTVPVILNYAGSTEYATKDNVYEVPHILHVGGYHTNRALADEKEVVKQLELAYTDKALWKQKSDNAIQTAQKYSWDRCAQGIHEQIQDVLRKEPNTLYVKRLN